MIGEDETTKIISMYQSGKNLNWIAKNIHRGVPSIKDVLEVNHIEIRGSFIKQGSKRNSNLTDFHKQLIDGLILGDGSIIRQKRDKTAKLSVRTTEKEFSNHVLSVLPLELKSYTYGATTRIIRGNECNCKENYKIESKVDNSLNAFRDSWYKDNKKIVPLNLDLSPTSVKYWFYGDGTSSLINNSKGVVVVLYTNNFTFDECKILQKQLIERIGILFHVNSDRGKPILKMSKKESVVKFFDYIGDCDINCYKYKWKIPQ